MVRICHNEAADTSAHGGGSLCSPRSSCAILIVSALCRLACAAYGPRFFRTHRCLVYSRSCNLLRAACSHRNGPFQAGVAHQPRLDTKGTAKHIRFMRTFCVLTGNGGCVVADGVWCIPGRAIFRELRCMLPPWWSLPGRCASLAPCGREGKSQGHSIYEHVFFYCYKKKKRLRTWMFIHAHYDKTPPPVKTNPTACHDRCSVGRFSNFADCHDRCGVGRPPMLICCTLSQIFLGFRREMIQHWRSPAATMNDQDRTRLRSMDASVDRRTDRIKGRSLKRVVDRAIGR